MFLSACLSRMPARVARKDACARARMYTRRIELLMCR